MAKKRGRPRKYPDGDKSDAIAGRSGVPLHTNIDPRINAALHACIEDSLPKATKTMLVEEGLLSALKKRGYWPWPRHSA
jgi:hypothetical protein